MAVGVGVVIAFKRRSVDIEDSLVVTTDGRPRPASEVAALVAFQERFFAGRIEALPVAGGGGGADRSTPKGRRCC